VSPGSDEANLRAALEGTAMLERSLASLRDSERRSAVRLATAQARYDEAVADLQASQHSLSDAQSGLASVNEERLIAEREAQRSEEERSRADEALRDATDVAARTQARAEALARALDEFSGSGGGAIIGNLEGVLGPFLELIEVDADWELAVESAAGASVGAMVVDGRKSARAALEALRREGGAGLILPVGDADVAAPATPDGCSALRSLVRERSGSAKHVTRVLDALFSRAFVAPDWESGIEVAILNPDLVIVTREGDRFASSGWRVASGRALVTRSTVEEARVAAHEAHNAIPPIRERHTNADVSAVSARQNVNRAATRTAQAEAEVERRKREIERLGELTAELAVTSESLVSDVAALTGQIVTIEDELVSLSAQLPELQRSVEEAADRANLSEEAERSLACIAIW
jgi:chromosome segregation protein